MPRSKLFDLPGACLVAYRGVTGARLPVVRYSVGTRSGNSNNSTALQGKSQAPIAEHPHTPYS